jgi:hypothetical protein
MDRFGWSLRDQREHRQLMRSQVRCRDPITISLDKAGLRLRTTGG